MATSKLVSELVINQLTAAQYWQAKENGEIKADELYLIIPEKPTAQTVDAYTRAESDERYQPKIGAVGFGFGFLPGRRPGATITTNTLGITFDKPIYVMGAQVATKADLAQLGDGVPSGTWFAPMGPSAWEVPRGVKVVKITWAGKDTYFKVKQGGVIRAMIMSDVFSGGYGDSWTAQRLKFYRAGGTVTDMKDHIPNFSELCQTEFAISWSEEINAHAVDVDLTK